uniref:efflux RND transporter periplasmic adaptor subunit n=1 Tax=Paractinoplanes polyasparticus TaxID=2856853 RepID=UPI001C85DB7F|nr:peptidoglycan-binding protein [Actinoplanes polyasparticus]
MNRKWTTAGIAAVLVAAGAGGYVYLANWSGGDNDAQASSNLPAATAEVTKQTLVDTESHDGSLAYANTTTIKTKLNGTVTALAAAGSTVKRGQKLYRIDNKPVVLLYGPLPAYRELASGAKGADVKQFEKNLWALGYRGFTVDSRYTASTATAVKEWQIDLGLTKTGTVELGRTVYATGAVRVDSLSANLDDVVGPGAGVLQVSSLGRVAAVELDIADQRLARKGAPVEVTMPDGSEVKGRITEVRTTVEEAQDESEQDTTKIDVTIGFAQTPAGLDEAAVTVDFVASQVKNVLTVPVNALLALSEGGYGVQVVEGGATRIVTVETGLFADGRVEVSGNGLAEGLKVGVPG